MQSAAWFLEERMQQLGFFSTFITFIFFTPWASLVLSFRTASKESVKMSEFLISGVNQDSFPEMMSGFAESIIV